MTYKLTGNKLDFYNVLYDLNIVAESVKHYPIFQPTDEETKQIVDISLRLIELLTVSEYNN
jgi:hypothetical protein